MNQALVDQIVRAVLYEGYVLYPYRPSVKSRCRWTFGGVYPQSCSLAGNGSEPCEMQTQGLITGEHSILRATVRFLHLTDRSVEALEPGGDPLVFRPVDSLTVGGRLFQSWQEALEREISIAPVGLSELAAHPHRIAFSFPPSADAEPLNDAKGRQAGRLVRRRQALAGIIELSAEKKGSGVFAFTVRVLNDSERPAAAQPDRNQALLQAFVSTHVVCGAEAGSFVSLTDPPPELREAAESCRNVGCWPVLVGQPGDADTLLSSPIILSDYPQVAPESPGDLFDGTEIDEILTLRILTLTDDEKRQAAALDDRVRDLMARTEALGHEELLTLHGAMRRP